MGKYIIAGLKTEFEPRYDLLRERAKEYEADFDSSETDIKIKIEEEFLKRKREQYPQLNAANHEYFWVGNAFNVKLLDYDGIMLHSSCVEKDGYAYLFSADCGTGKSTHTHLWLKNLSGTRIINDDKPVLIKENGVWCACGTPFSGKTDENCNVKVPIRAIVFIKRGEEKNIFPYQDEADCMFNSSIIYELAALKKYAIPLLEEITNQDKEYSEARRLIAMLKYFESIEEEELIPNNSLLREFIGGSIFE